MHMIIIQTLIPFFITLLLHPSTFTQIQTKFLSYFIKNLTRTSGVGSIASVKPNSYTRQCTHQPIDHSWSSVNQRVPVLIRDTEDVRNRGPFTRNPMFSRECWIGELVLHLGKLNEGKNWFWLMVMMKIGFRFTMSAIGKPYGRDIWFA